MTPSPAFPLPSFSLGEAVSKGGTASTAIGAVTNGDQGMTDDQLAFKAKVDAWTAAGAELATEAAAMGL